MNFIPGERKLSLVVLTDGKIRLRLGWQDRTSLLCSLIDGRKSKCSKKWRK